ncbi:hypothetical protein CHS0354_015853 [Potamilus streckersoni]|uniref:Uncharacterized protein n=1 Tax=Potamilus streckersoni TaxID=2493646 RepID=A0AAE0SEI5_9BIVA|nr:hypothetical protein CHS0354_015853 [Potamilus streckersoni]
MDDVEEHLINADSHPDRTKDLEEQPRLSNLDDRASAASYKSFMDDTIITSKSEVEDRWMLEDSGDQNNWTG